jgi:Protein of unknown function (DUF3037)
VPAEYTYDYAIIRVVPRVERGERINAGVILILRGPAVPRSTHRTRCAGRSRVGSRRGHRGHPGEPRDDPGRVSRWTRRGAHRGAAGSCALPVARLAPQHDRADVTRPHRAHARPRCSPRAPDGHGRQACAGAFPHSWTSLIPRRVDEPARQPPFTLPFAAGPGIPRSP